MTGGNPLSPGTAILLVFLIENVYSAVCKILGSTCLCVCVCALREVFMLPPMSDLCVAP